MKLSDTFEKTGCKDHKLSLQRFKINYNTLHKKRKYSFSHEVPRRVRRRNREYAESHTLDLDEFVQFHNFKYLHYRVVYADNLYFSVLFLEAFIKKDDLSDSGARNGFQSR